MTNMKANETDPVRTDGHSRSVPSPQNTINSCHSTGQDREDPTGPLEERQAMPAHAGVSACPLGEKSILTLFFFTAPYPHSTGGMWCVVREREHVH